MTSSVTILMGTGIGSFLGLGCFSLPSSFEIRFGMVDLRFEGAVCTGVYDPPIGFSQRFRTQLCQEIGHLWGVTPKTGAAKPGPAPGLRMRLEDNIIWDMLSPVSQIGHRTRSWRGTASSLPPSGRILANELIGGVALKNEGSIKVGERLGGLLKYYHPGRCEIGDVNPIFGHYVAVG